jgi:hypothetical protein
MNIATPIVALVAGIVAILGLETRASSAVGVAISVTTIPRLRPARRRRRAREGAHQAFGALEVLGVNVALLLVGSYAA